MSTTPNLGLRIPSPDGEIISTITTLADNMHLIDGAFGGKKYGIRINKNDSHPDTRVEYMYDAVGMTPAYMDYNTMEFNYGSWQQLIEWINTPVMLKYDGTVDYLLDPNDQTLKLDGSPSDISDPDYPGNAMARFRRMWIKEWEDENYEYIVFSHAKHDEDYHAHSFTDSRGNVREYMYHAMYEGSYHDSRLRSLADQSVMTSQSGETEIARAEANGDGWHINYKSQRDFITYLLWMISKSTYDKQKFGMGNISSDNYLQTGTLKDTGRFMGYADTDKAVKVFYIENFWGNYWKRMSGLIMDLDGQIFTKMTPPYTQPTGGHTVMPTGYTPTGVIPSGGSGTYLRSVSVTRDTGLVPVQIGGSATTCYTCGLWYTVGGTIKWARVGGRRGNGALCGAGSVSLTLPLSNADSSFTAALSFLENPS